MPYLYTHDARLATIALADGKGTVVQLDTIMLAIRYALALIKHQQPSPSERMRWQYPIEEEKFHTASILLDAISV